MDAAERLSQHGAQSALQQQHVGICCCCSGLGRKGVNGTAAHAQQQQVGAILRC